MKCFKVTTVILGLIYIATLFITLIIGCTYDETTLYWIKIRGIDLMNYDMLGIALLIAPVFMVLIILFRWPTKARVLLLLLWAAIGGWSYVLALTSAWREAYQAAVSMDLYPGCVATPMMLMLMLNAAIASVWLERKGIEGENHDENFDGTAECIDSSL